MEREIEMIHRIVKVSLSVALATAAVSGTLLTFAEDPQEKNQNESTISDLRSQVEPRAGDRPRS